jgi:hypothetical protein
LHATGIAGDSPQQLLSTPLLPIGLARCSRTPAAAVVGAAPCRRCCCAELRHLRAAGSAGERPERANTQHVGMPQGTATRSCCGCAVNLLLKPNKQPLAPSCRGTDQEPNTGGRWDLCPAQSEQAGTSVAACRYLRAVHTPRQPGGKLQSAADMTVGKQRSSRACGSSWMLIAALGLRAAV